MKTIVILLMTCFSIAIKAQLPKSITQKASEKLKQQGIVPIKATPQQWQDALQSFGKTDRVGDQVIICTDEFDNRATVEFSDNKLVSTCNYFSGKEKNPDQNMPIYDTKGDNSKTTIVKPDSNFKSKMPIKN